MFSTSMTASSTTTPSATTSPPRLIVFSDRPQALRIHTVASSETGMALKEMKAPRQSRSVTSNSTTTSTAPIRSELRSLAMALSMKLAGRSSAGWYCTSCCASAGARTSSRCSRSRVTSRVLAPNCVEVSTRIPGRPPMMASPKRGPAPSRICATSSRRTGTPPRVVTSVCPSAATDAAGACACSTMRWLGVSR